MSKQDTHFFNVFSMVIGLLGAVAIALFALARIVASQTQDKQVFEDASYVKNVEERLSPFAKVAVAGQDNAALAIKPTLATPAIAAAANSSAPRRPLTSLIAYTPADPPRNRLGQPTR